MIRQDKQTHGTRTNYWKNHCRCPECRRANSEYLKQYRRSRKEDSGRKFEYQKIAKMALEYVKNEHPDVYEEMLSKAGYGQES